MVKVGDRVYAKDIPKPGVIEAITDRYELRPYTHLVSFDDLVLVFTEDELELIPDGPGTEG